MKKLISIGLPFLAVACGGSSETPSLDETAAEVPIIEDTSIFLEETDSVVVYEPLNEDGVWEIDDYAEQFIGGKIAMDSEHADFSDGPGWYYSVLDKKGGYANVTGALEGWKEFVIWRTASGEDLIGTMTAGCGPACSYNFEFYLGIGKDVRLVEFAEILPMGKIVTQQKNMYAKAIAKYGKTNIDYAEDQTLFFRFPQNGTSMEVDLIIGADEIQFPIMKLKWNKSFFEVEQKYTEVDEI